MVVSLIRLSQIASREAIRLSPRRNAASANMADLPVVNYAHFPDYSGGMIVAEFGRATLYHLLTGVKPTDALTRARALRSSLPNPLTTPHEINQAVGPELSMILGRAMAHDPRERILNAGDFREALRRLGRIDDLPGNVYGPDYAGELYNDRSCSPRLQSSAVTIHGERR